MPMNFTRTAFLLVALMALFLAVGAAIGGKSGLVLAFVLALGMNVMTLMEVRQARPPYAQSAGGRCQQRRRIL